jgi:hypothetical protein
VPRVYLLLHSNGDLRNSTVAGRLQCSQHVGGFHGRLSRVERFKTSTHALKGIKLGSVCTVRLPQNTETLGQSFIRSSRP